MLLNNDLHPNPISFKRLTVRFTYLLSLLFFNSCSVEKILCSTISGNGQISNFSPVDGCKDTDQISSKLLALFISENREDPLGNTIAIVA